VAQSKTFRRRQQDIVAFAEALARFLDVCAPQHEPFGGYPTWAPQPGQEAEAAQRAAEVDRTAGRAALAFGREFYIDWKPRGTFQTQPVSPATRWRTILDRDPDFGVDVIFTVSNQAIGALDVWADEADEHEQSLAGKIERITGRSRRGSSRTESGHLRSGFIAATLGIPPALVVAYLAHRFGWV
jgi:hypothetical protein